MSELSLKTNKRLYDEALKVAIEKDKYQPTNIFGENKNWYTTIVKAMDYKNLSMADIDGLNLIINNEV